MARAIDLDPPMMFRFGVVDIDVSDDPKQMGMTVVRLSPDGCLTGPGNLTVRSRLQQPIIDLLSRKGSRSIQVLAYGRDHQDHTKADFVFHVSGARPGDGKVATIEWDATKSGVLYIEATMPYDSLIVTSGEPIDQLAAQA